MSRIPFLILSLLDFVVFVVTTLIFSSRSEAMCNFFNKRGYPAFVVQAGHHHSQQIDRQSALQTSQRDNNDRIPFTLTFHPHNHAVKSIILKNFKLLQSDPDLSGRIFSQPPLILFKRDKNVGNNFLIRSVFQTSDQPVTFKCARARSMQNMSFHPQRWENIGTQAIDQDQWSFHLYLSQCHLLHNLHSLKKIIHRRNRETTWLPIPRTPPWRRERRPKRI